MSKLREHAGQKFGARLRSQRPNERCQQRVGLSSREELHSDFLAAISLASETELFIDQLQEGRGTLTFAEGHLAYLHKEAVRSAGALWLVGTSKVYPAVGADIVMESISLIDHAGGV